MAALEDDDTLLARGSTLHYPDVFQLGAENPASENNQFINIVRYYLVFINMECFYAAPPNKSFPPQLVTYFQV